MSAPALPLPMAPNPQDPDSDLEDRDHRIRMLELEARRLAHTLNSKRRISVRRRRRIDRLEERLNVERAWRLRVQGMPWFRAVIKLLGRAWLLRDPWGRHKLSAVPDPGESRAALPDLIRLKSRPTFSVLMAHSAAEPERARDSIQSLCDQAYPHWELRVAVAASTAPDSLEALISLDRDGNRIRVVRIEDPAEPARLLIRAAAEATGDFLAWLDPGDRLAPHALLRLAQAISLHPDTDLLYSDEDRILHDNRTDRPRFKPDYSPELLLATDYLGRFLAIQRGLFDTIGGIGDAFDEGGEYDLVLRATEHARRVEHLPERLYHRRNPLDASTLTESAWTESSRRALSAAVQRRGWRASVEHGIAPGLWRVRFDVDPAARVTVIIPTSDNAAALRACIQSLRSRTAHPAFDILVVSNNTADPGALDYLERGASDGLFRVIRRDIPFNFAALNNFAVSQCDSPYLLFLNDDTEALHPDWMTAMLEYAQLPAIGAVGAKLLFPSGVVQHGGIVLTEDFSPNHAFLWFEEDAPGPLNLNLTTRNCAAVTGACLMTRRATFLEVGGFDEALAIAFNDVDFCLKLVQAGYRVVLTPHARLMHGESLSRGDDRGDAWHQRHSTELQHLRRRWSGVFGRDPYRNPNLRFVEDGL